MKKKVLGVGVDDLSLGEILTMVSRWLNEENKNSKAMPIVSKIIATPGPEFLLTARKDPEFKKILNVVNLAPNESFGINLYAGFDNRVPGIDLMLALCRLAAENKWTVGLFGGADGVAQKTASKLKAIYPNISITYTIDGAEADKILSDLSDSGDPGSRKIKPVDLLFVALGHPKQEKFLWGIKESNSNRSPLTAIRFRVGMGVGGSFDLINGTLPRAPRFVRSLGFEWLWRFFTKPGHISRVLRATFLFPFLLLVDKFNLSK